MEEVKTVEKTNIEKMQDALEQMKVAGEGLFKDEIAALEKKIETAKAEAESTVDEVQQTFIEKYGAKAWELLKAAGLMVIIYRLFF
jgi:hypothetical protein